MCGAKSSSLSLSLSLLEEPLPIHALKQAMTLALRLKGCPEKRLEPHGLSQNHMNHEVRLAVKQPFEEAGTDAWNVGACWNPVPYCLIVNKVRKLLGSPDRFS